MTIDDIVTAVRYCIDEEAVNSSELYGASAYDFANGAHTDIGLMDNIIRSKISDALAWISACAPSELLGGLDEYGLQAGFIHEESGVTARADHRIVLPSNFVKLLRVRGSSWHRAIMGESLLREDSNEYLQLMDSHGATATNDRPQAAIIEKKTKELEVWPREGEFEYSCVVSDAVFVYRDTMDFYGFVENVSEEPYSLINPVGVHFDTAKKRFVGKENLLDSKWYNAGNPSTEMLYVMKNGEVDENYRWNGSRLVKINPGDVVVPTLVRTAFAYYIAYLVLAAYGDARSERMLTIAKESLWRKDDK